MITGLPALVDRSRDRWPALSRVPAWLAWLGASAVVIIGYVVADETTRNVLYPAISMGSAILILLGIRRNRPAAMARWLVVAGGMAALAVGDAGYSFVPGWDTFPSPPDMCYLVGYVLLLVALVAFARHTGGSGAILDAGIVTVAAGVLLWALVIDPYVEDPTLDPVALTVAIAYPLFDLAFIGLLARGALGAPVRSAALMIFTAGVIAYLLSDIIYSTQSVTDTYTGGWVDLGWIIGYALWAAAALHPSMSRMFQHQRAADDLSNRRLVGIGLVAVAPLVAAGTQQLLYQHIDPLPAAIAAAAMFALIVLRLAGVVRTQRVLLDQRRVLEGTLARQAVEDPLTSLPNRRGFLDRVAAAVAADRDHVAVLFLDLDDFKSVNDSLGHAAGDELLTVVGQRLRSVVRAEDAVARLGGDEFAILARQCPSPLSAMAFAERVHRAIGIPTSLSGTTVAVHVSVGVAMGGPDADDAAILMRDADLAVYRAKSLGKSRCELYDPNLYRDLLRQLAIRDGLEHVLEGDELELRFQPIIDLATSRIRSCEALVRWRHPSLGLLGPAEFLQAAEQVGVMPAIGLWVLQEACLEAGRWARSGHPGVGVNVNLAACQLRSDDIEREVALAIEQAGIPAASLMLEITETSLDEASGAQGRLERLRALGVHLSIDDFGTGYSSLARVAQLPVSELKLDRSLIDGDEAMVQAVLQFGHLLGVHVVAEGIETRGQLGRMRDLGCDAGQGYRLARPLTSEQVEAFLDRPTATRHASAAAPPPDPASFTPASLARSDIAAAT